MGREWVTKLNYSQISYITRIYYPGCAGVRGNEMAERLAVRAADNDAV